MIFLHLSFCLLQKNKQTRDKFFFFFKENQTQSFAIQSLRETSDLLQPVGSVLNLLQRVSLQLRQLGHGIAELLAQQRILLPKLLHRDSDLGQRATAAFALLTKRLGDNEWKEECAGEASEARDSFIKPLLLRN